jgi:AraC-like DNA-binding protein
MSVPLQASFVTGFALPAPKTRLSMHRHAHLEILHNLRGSGTSTTAGGQEFSFGPGDVCLYPAFLRHDRRFTSPGTALVIRLHLADPVPPELRLAHHVRAPLPPWVLVELRALAGPHGLLEGFARQALDHRCSALLCALLAAAVPSVPVDADQVLADRADRLIAERFASLGRLEEIARELGVGYDRLRRVFRRHHGQSLVARLTAVRIRRAQELLANSPLGHQEIALQCGYGSARYLNRVFRKVVGRAPGGWRR